MRRVRRRIHVPRHRGLLLVAFFKLLKGSLLLAVGVGALRLVHHDVAAMAERIVEAIRVDPHHQFVSHLLDRLELLNDHRLKVISAFSFGYATVLLVEGVGLFLEKRWAEYLTIILTASLIPLELYEIARHLSPLRIGALVVNVAIVVYLIRIVRQDRRQA